MPSHVKFERIEWREPEAIDAVSGPATLTSSTLNKPSLYVQVGRPPLLIRYVFEDEVGNEAVCEFSVSAVVETNKCRDGNGNNINEGRSVPSDDPCNVGCVCSDGERRCAEITCRLPPGIAWCKPIDIPGECCPSYEHCTDSNPCRDGNGYPVYEGQSIPSNDPCKVNCVCLNGEHICAEYGCAPPPPGIAGCQPINIDGECCPSYEHCIESNPCRDANGNPIFEGQRVLSDDPCKVNCVCLNGEHICAEYGCAAPPPGIAGCQPITRPGECCPSYDHCDEGNVDF